MGDVNRRAAALAAGTLLLLCSLVQIAADHGLPTAWRQGIATNYGGAQDGMVRLSFFLSPDFSRPSLVPCSAHCLLGLFMHMPNECESIEQMI